MSIVDMSYRPLPGSPVVSSQEIAPSGSMTNYWAHVVLVTCCVCLAAVENTTHGREGHSAWHNALVKP